VSDDVLEKKESRELPPGYRLCKRGTHQIPDSARRCTECEKIATAARKAKGEEPNQYPRGKHPNSLEHTFQKGVSGNPLGNKVLSPELRMAQKLTKAQLTETATMIVNCTLPELKAIAEDENSTVLQRMALSLALRVIENGDTFAWDALLNRIVGKVTDKLHVSGSISPQVIITLPSNGREVKELELAPMIEAKNE
jgi:hypothetical protein